VEAVAGAATGIAAAAGKGGCLEAVSETKLAIGLMRADVFGGKNRCFAADGIHEINSCGNRTMFGGR
jgi:hypothetical protein